MSDQAGYHPDKHITPVYPRDAIREVCSRLGAERLAVEIQGWWHKHGYPQVRAWVDEQPCVGAIGTVYSVRTNLINGMPPKERARQLRPDDA